MASCTRSNSACTFSISASLSVSPNATTNPILSATNLTGPTSLTDGSTYSFWVNVTVGGGVKAVATTIVVQFYLLSSTGTGSKTYLAGSPSSVEFYNYTSKGVVNATAYSKGSYASLAYNRTVRAEITWDPGVTGNFILYANATAANEYAGDYGTANIASLSITVKANPTTELIEYGLIALAVVVVIAVLILWYRRGKSPRRAAASKGSTGKGGLERGPKKGDADDGDDA